MRCAGIDECLRGALRAEKRAPEKLRYGIFGGLTPPQRAVIKHKDGEILAESWPGVITARAENAAGETIWPTSAGRPKKPNEPKVQADEPEENRSSSLQPVGDAPAPQEDFKSRISEVINGRLRELEAARQATAS